MNQRKKRQPHWCRRRKLAFQPTLVPGEKRHAVETELEQRAGPLEGGRTGKAQLKRPAGHRIGDQKLLRAELAEDQPGPQPSESPVAEVGRAQTPL